MTHSGGVSTVITVIVVSLVVAAIVIALAALNDTDRQQDANFFADIRDGWLRLWGRGPEDEDITEAAQDYSIDDLFNVGDTKAPAYVEPKELEGYVTNAANRVGLTRQ